MGVIALFVPLGAFVMFAVVVGLVTRLIATTSLQRTIREALRTDPGSVPVLVERLDRHPPWGDALLGWIFLALAAALALLAITEPDEEERFEMLRATIVPVVVGAAVLLYARLQARATPKG
jgi:quinol-cytochrome oxidoreductase complex cytochrome b subunit